VEHCPFPFNNFIYKIELSEPALPSAFAKQPLRPGTLLPPKAGVSTLILRLSNPRADGLNNTNRVENEVATQHLFRQHLYTNHPHLIHIIPAIYAWAPCRYPEVPDETGFAWTLCEFMHGTNLDSQFAEMDIQQKLDVIGQVAEIFAAFQATPLPQHFTNHLGGLTFGDRGQVVAGQMPLLPPGPWSTLEALWASRYRQQLADTDKSFALDGWKDIGIRERVDKFLGSDKIVQLLAVVDTTQRTLVHGDLSKLNQGASPNRKSLTHYPAMNNMLYSQTTGHVTAILDFDWASVLHPAHEFFTGLWDLGGDTHPADAKLQTAVLTGKFNSLGEQLSDENKSKWDIAEAWDNALATRNATRPSSIKGIEVLEKLRRLEELLCPFQLGNETMVARIKTNSPESLQGKKNDAAKSLIDMLESLGA
jgi:hypothetical protein